MLRRLAKQTLYGGYCIAYDAARISAMTTCRALDPGTYREAYRRSLTFAQELTAPGRSPRERLQVIAGGVMAAAGDTGGVVENTGTMLNRWAWGFTQAAYTAGSREPSVISPDTLALSRDHYGRREWLLISETIPVVRAQLGMDRTTDPNDTATRALVKRTVWGILASREDYPDLRKADAARLAPVIAELALSPIAEEIDALRMASSQVMTNNRELARGEWSAHPSTWSDWVRQTFGSGTTGKYLPAVSQPGF